MFEKRKNFPSLKSLPSAFKKLEWKLAEELGKLEQRRSVRQDEEFEKRLLALVKEYAADHETVLAALRSSRAKGC